MEYESFPVFKEPQCLIESSADGKLKVVDNVLAQISQINEQLNVVAITGLYRTGKSYLLNRLANSKKGFAFQAETKGIWAWCRPHPARKGEVLLLLDTEGLGDIKKGDIIQDNWIFTLATLLASTLVYNVSGLFDKGAMDKLSFVTEMSKQIRKSANKEEDANLDIYFPHFILTVRDFRLDLEKDGREITSDEYLEDCLALRSGNKEYDVKYNAPRKCIREYFENRKCFTFEWPGSKKVCKDIERLSDKDLNDDFVADSIKFTTYVLDKCNPKSLGNGQVVTGRMFATLTQTYVTAIRNCKTPCIERALDSMTQSEDRKAVEGCEQVYVDEMDSMVHFPVLNKNGNSDAHHEIIYDRDQDYQRKSNEKMNAEYENIKVRNVHESEVKCKEALAHLNKTIEEKIKEHVYTRPGGYGLYQQDIMDIINLCNEKYDLGCKKEEMLLKYMMNKWIEGQTILQAYQQETVKNAETERQKTTEAERQRKLAEEQSKKYENELRQLRELVLKQNQEAENQMKTTNDNVNERRLEQNQLEVVVDKEEDLRMVVVNVFLPTTRKSNETEPVQVEEEKCVNIKNRLQY